MRAAVLREFKTPLSVEEAPRPIPGPDEVLVQVEACGVCHSDLHLAEGDWPQLAAIVKKPLILGHEIAGRVVERGADVRDLQPGDRVGIPWIHRTCGDCEFCRDGIENLCVKQQITGVTVDGGFAEFVKAPAGHATRIPAPLSAVEAAPLMCAGVTVYRALRQTSISPGQRLAVFGVGGLGHIAVQLGVALGAEVLAIDLEDDKLALAQTLGATSTLNARHGSVVKALRGLGGVHVALVTSAAKAAYDMALPCLRPTGTLLVVGLPSEDISFPALLMAAGELRVRASAVGTRRDLQEVLQLAADGKLHCRTSTRSLSEVNAVLDEMRSGKISGRVVLSPP